jgi:tRNA threonylcarbamoyladenosine biosynthesis protein TsaE
MATIISRSPDETFRAGREEGATVRAGEVLALVGDLGAGKTQWVKGLAAGLGAEGAVTSPTFTLIHEYTGGRLPLYHLDWYRIEQAAEIAGIGFDDYLDGRGVIVIEWADKFPHLLPPGTRWLHFKIGAEDEREIAW